MQNTLMPSSYLTGVLLGINAITDSYLWVDSPDCFFMKVDNIQGNHDLNSTLRRANGEHRILSTISDVDNVIDNRNSSFIKTLSDMASREYTSVIFVTSMPMSQLIGVDYDGLIRVVREDFPEKDIFHIPSRSMTDCWIDGYGDLLFSLAKNINIDNARPEKNKVAIIGNMFDRHEGDARANMAEIRRLVTSLGLEVVSVWLDGGTYQDILRVREAGTILSLPYGRKAAKKMAKRLEIDILELDIPFGFGKTTEFIKTLGNHFGKDTIQIDEIIEQELRSNDIGIMRHMVRDMFAGKKVVYYGDPFLAPGIIDITHMLGMELINIYVHGGKNHKVLEYPEAIHDFSSDNISAEEADIFITIRNSGIHVEEKKIVEFSFPSYYHHVFTEIPYYGTRGTLNFINRIYNTLLLQ